MKTRLILIFLLLTALLSSCDSYFNKSFISKEVVFTNNVDGTALSGTLTLPKSKNKVPAVILIHGSGPMNRDLEFGNHQPFKDLAEYLSKMGIAVLRYDKRGVGKSTGQFSPYDWESFKNDGIAGVQYLKSFKEIDSTKIGAIGLSEGGLIVPMIANSSADVSFVVLLGSPGVWGKELIYTSQLAISKAAGFNQDEIKSMTNTFNELWHYISKPKLSIEEEEQGKLFLKELWNYIDSESRTDFGFTDESLNYHFNLYRSENILKSYNYKPEVALSKLRCHVLALNGDKDVQTVTNVHFPVIEKALEHGECKSYQVKELKNHNHIFQICRTGKISEYKEINGTMSEESMTIIKDWILKTTNSVPFDSVEVRFLNQEDSIQLAGTITIPKVDKKVPAVLLIQGSGPHNRNEEMYGLKPFEDLSNYLSGRGIAVLRVDRRGCGESEGTYLDLDMNNYVEDALCAVEFLKSHPKIDATKIGLIGHSLGGLISALVSNQTDDVTFIVSCAGPGIWGKDIVFSQNKLWAQLSGAKDSDIQKIKVLCDRWFDLLMKESVTQTEIDEFAQIYIRLSGYLSDDLCAMFYPGPSDKALMYFRSPQYISALQIDPLSTWKNVKCPVLAINGSRDFQVASKENLEGIRRGLIEGGSMHFKIVELENHNHMFQQTQNGSPSEVSGLRGTFSPIALNLIADWIESIDRE